MLRFEDNGDGGAYYRGDQRLLRVTEILNLAGLSPGFWVDEAMRRIGSQRGTAVHRATELVDQNRLDWDDLDPLLAGFMRGYDLFIKEHTYHVLGSEERVYHADLDYAGTLDRVCVLDGDQAIVDVKTAYAIERWVGLQLAGYALADRKADGTPVSRNLFRRFALQLKPEGAYRLVSFDDPHELEVFRAAVEIAKWKRRCPAP